MLTPVLCVENYKQLNFNSVFIETLCSFQDLYFSD